MSGRIAWRQPEMFPANASTGVSPPGAPLRSSVPLVACLILSTSLLAACDYSDFIPDFDVPDTYVSDIPFSQPDDWVPSDDGQPGFIITSASPLTGPAAGGTRVTIEGRGFLAGSTVLFGPKEGVETVVENEYSIKSTSPAWAGYSETVDIFVVRPDGKKTVLRPGFSYRAGLEITAVTPSAGPVAGGTPIAISGHGFAPDSNVVIDGRAAISVTRLDDSTILAVTPPGQPGAVEVLVLSGNASGRLGRSFRYVAPPSGLSCAPAVIDMAGPSGDRLANLAISGDNIDAVDSVSLSTGRVVSFSTELPGTIPAVVDFSGVTAGGPVDVTLSGPGGSVTEKGCFTALERDAIDDPELRIRALSPRAVPATGGVACTLTVTGLDIGNPQALSVRVGSTTVSVTDVPDMNTVRFTAPAGAPGTVDVRLDSPQESAVLEDALTRLRDVGITGIEPPTAPPGGGTAATIRGHGLSDAVEVLIGPFPAVISGAPSDTSIPVIVPDAGPGVHDVTVMFADGGRAKLTGALTCTADNIEVTVVTPSRGSLAGGTIAYVTGSGLLPGTRVFFDRYEADVVDDGDPGRMTIRTPAGDSEGFVDVFVVGGDGIRHTLADAFEYFNPAGFLGGVWGDSISGAVNVTVIDSYNDTPIPQAFVMIDSDPDTPFKGFTDGRGMITLSGRGLAGPLMVTATRQDYTTWSIAGVDAENITLYLEPLYNQIPPDTGTGGEDNEFPLTPGLVTGKVTGTDKEFMAPPGTCDGIPLTNGTMCRPCGSDNECGAGSICLTGGSTAGTCSRTCMAREDCPSGWDCYQAGDQGTVCKPTPGIEEVRCGIADATSTRWSDTFGPGAIMTATGTYALNSRLGDVAVYCLGGFRRTGDGVFVPVIMGLTRHVPVTTSAISRDIDVRLSIPLDRTLRLRMIAPPGGRNGPTFHMANVTLYLGSDGYLNLWPQLYGTDRSIFDFTGLPARFEGPLAGSRLYVSAEADSPNESGEPYSIVYPKTWEPLVPDAFMVMDDGSIESAGTVAIDAVASCSSDSGSVVVDSAHRAWFVALDSTVTAMPAIGASDISACSWTADGRVVFAGDRSRTYFLDPSDMTVVAETTSTESAALNVVTACGETVWAAGGGRLFARDGLGQWHRVPYGTPAPVTSLECLDESTAIGTGPGGTLFIADDTIGSTVSLPGISADLDAAVFAEGILTVVGTRGTILQGPSPSLLEPVETGALDDFTRAIPMTDGRVLVGGSRGIVGVLDGGVFTMVRKPSDQTEISAFAASKLGGAASGAPVLTFRRDSLMAGPFVNIPRFSSPTENWLWLDRTISWGIETPPAPSFYYMRLYTVGVTGRWSIIADGKTRSIDLPDVGLASGLGIRPIQPGTVSLWTYSVLSHGFDIDNYDSTSLYTGKWDAWSATGILTKFF